ncbi:MAG: hypothetical protein ACRDZ5_02700 [Acidimicrobiales bacterium]
MLGAVGTNNMVVPQILTFAIPVGTFFAVLLWGFFVRRRSV